MADVIEARVKQKKDTLANWEANPMIILDGEQAFVVNGSGQPINFKIGDGTKRFSELPFWIQYDQAAFIPISGLALPTPTQTVGYSLLGEGTYTHASGGFTVPSGHWGVANWDGSAWSFSDMGLLPTLPVEDSLNSTTGTKALSDKQGVILKEYDLMNGSLSVDDIKLWASSWYWNDLTDNSKIVLGRREDIQQVRVGKFNASINQWVVKDVLPGKVVYNKSNKRSFIVKPDGKLEEVFDNKNFFSNRVLSMYPVLSTIKGVNITRKTISNITAISVVRFLVSTSTPQIIINVNDVLSGANASQTFVINVNIADFSDVSNINVSAENDNLKIDLNFDFSNLSSYESFNAQTFDKSLWGRLNNFQVNSQFIDSKFLKSTESFSEFFNKNSFSGGLTKDYAQFFKDMMFIYPHDFSVYKYFFRVIRKGYTGDGAGNEYQILLFRQPISDTGLTNAQQIAGIIKGSIDPSGVEMLTLNPYEGTLKSKFYVLVDWNNLPTTYNGVFTSVNNTINQLAFNGGNGIIKSTFEPKTFKEISDLRLDNYKLGNVFFKKSFFNATAINDYTLSNDGVIPINDKLTDLRYINLGANIKFLGVDANNHYWFNDASDNSISYCANIEDVLTLTLTKVRTFTNLPVLCRRLQNNELLVVTQGSLSLSKVAEIWVSSSNRTSWSMKMTFDNSNNETNVINMWGFSQYGSRVVLSGYGKRYTSGEPSADAPKYTDLEDRANYSIYYSPDNGVTWYNRLFNLGNLHPFVVANTNFKPYAHIHAVTIDPYWGEIMVTHGDLPVESDTQGQQNRVFISTNLKEWEAGQKNGTPVPLQWTSSVEKKFGGVGAMKDVLMFGSDDVPNGVYVAARTDKNKIRTEIMYTEDKWSYQRANGNPGTAGEYGIWGGYSFYQRNNNQPMYLTNVYVAGALAQDYKRCQVLATYNGYKFFKVWESDRDLLSSSGILTNTNMFVATDDYNNVIIQTKDSRFNALVGGLPAQTNDYTLIVSKGI